MLYVQRLVIRESQFQPILLAVVYPFRVNKCAVHVHMFQCLRPIFVLSVPCQRDSLFCCPRSIKFYSLVFFSQLIHALFNFVLLSSQVLISHLCVLSLSHESKQNKFRPIRANILVKPTLRQICVHIRLWLSSISIHSRATSAYTFIYS